MECPGPGPGPARARAWPRPHAPHPKGVSARTAELADRHLAVRPGSDAALLFAVVHVLFDEDLVREVVTPLPTVKAIEMLQRCLTQPELAIWRALGDYWLNPRQVMLYTSDVQVHIFVRHKCGE